MRSEVPHAVSRARPQNSCERSYNGHYMKAGQAAEARVLGWLEVHSGVIGVEDLRGLRQMREADVDCSVQLVDGRMVLAEIKSDWHLGVSGNVLFETLRINHTAPPDRAVTLGWSARTPARWILYYAPQKDCIYQISTDDLRSGLQAYTSELRSRSRLSYVETDRIKSTVNVLIPERFVAHRVHEL